MTKPNRLIMFREITVVYFSSRAKQKALQALQAVVGVH